jgi:mannosyltransferase OCH1-like enzyme
VSIVERGNPGDGTWSDTADENTIKIAMRKLVGAKVHALSLNAGVDL